jgi:hypothetical protein
MEGELISLRVGVWLVRVVGVLFPSLDFPAEWENEGEGGEIVGEFLGVQLKVTQHFAPAF